MAHSGAPTRTGQGRWWRWPAAAVPAGGAARWL